MRNYSKNLDAEARLNEKLKAAHRSELRKWLRGEKVVGTILTILVTMGWGGLTSICIFNSLGWVVGPERTFFSIVVSAFGAGFALIVYIYLLWKIWLDR